MRRSRAWPAGVGLLLLVLTACTGAESDERSAEPACRLSAKLVPSCGALWGISTTPKTPEAIGELESTLDRQFDLVYFYHDLKEEVPSRAARELARNGKLLHIAIAARDYENDEAPISYASIAAGDHDADLRRQATGVASLKTPVYLTFEQEANQKDKVGAKGQAEDFKAAWRHVYEVFEDAGASNAVWVWVMTGREENLQRAGELWPGNDVVDWISWNVYNSSACQSGTVKADSYSSFEDRVAPFFDWVKTEGASFGINARKPMMISEAGSVISAEDPGRAADWYTSIPSILRKYPQIKAVTLWDSMTSDACDYRFRRSEDVLSAVKAAGLDPWLNGRNRIPEAPR